MELEERRNESGGDVEDTVRHTHTLELYGWQCMYRRETHKTRTHAHTIPIHLDKYIPHAYADLNTRMLHTHTTYVYLSIPHTHTLQITSQHYLSSCRALTKPLHKPLYH